MATDKNIKPPISASAGSVVEGVTFMQGGLGNIKGLRCAGVSAGFRRHPERRDLALVVADEPCVAAAMFTKNKFCAAPVALSRKHLMATKAAGEQEATQGIKAIVLNSGNANAATGAPGMATATHTADIAAELLACKPEQVLVASTGVIGVPLPTDKFDSGLPMAISALGQSDGGDLEAGGAAAMAIMTTDTHPKEAAVKFSIEQADGSAVEYRIGGMVKGSGMIEPNMATMLGVLATDAPLSWDAANVALHRAVGQSLNKVTVDSDSSTNDSVFLMATAAAGGDTITAHGSALDAFAQALCIVCQDLARQIAYDGEGATKLVTVNVRGAASEADADLAARAVANSPLVKTAIAGHDANWGRVAMAIGKSGAEFAQEYVDISIMGLAVCRGGLTVAFDEEEALRLFAEEPEIVIDVDLGAGEAATTIWTCDMTHEYITINGDYRT